MPDLGTIDKPSPEFETMDDSGGKLRREFSNNNAKVRKISSRGVDYTHYIFQEQLETKQKKCNMVENHTIAQSSARWTIQQTPMK